jgi:hypothetical protein
MRSFKPDDEFASHRILLAAPQLLPNTVRFIPGKLVRRETASGAGDRSASRHWSFDIGH